MSIAEISQFRIRAKTVSRNLMQLSAARRPGRRKGAGRDYYFSAYPEIRQSIIRSALPVSRHMDQPPPFVEDGAGPPPEDDPERPGDENQNQVPPHGCNINWKWVAFGGVVIAGAGAAYLHLYQKVNVLEKGLESARKDLASLAFLMDIRE